MLLSDTIFTSLKLTSMRTTIKQFLQAALMILMVSGAITACNKIPEVVDLPSNIPTGKTIADEIAGDPDYSVLKAGLDRTGLTTTLSNPGSAFTLFAPNNLGMSYFGINATTVMQIPLADLTAILSYHVIPQKLPRAAVPDTFPNAEMPTMLKIPGAPDYVRNHIFIYRHQDTAFANFIPFVGPERVVANGVIHPVQTVIFPPTKMLMERLVADTSLTYLVAAIQRADLGLPDGMKITQLFSNPLTSFTLFAPDNNAFRKFLTLIGMPSTDISMIQNIPIPNLIGVLAYHVHVFDATPPANIHFSRALSDNFPTAPTPINTLLKLVNYPNPTPPIVLAQLIGVKGYANTTYSVMYLTDQLCFNGVYHKIDQVMRPF